MSDTSTTSTTPGRTARRSTAARRPRALLWWGLALTVLVIVFGLTLKASGTLGTVAEGDGKTGEAVVSTWTQGIDNWWAGVFGGQQGDETSPLGLLFEYLLGGLGGMVMTLVLAIVLLCLRHWRSAILVFFAPTIATMLATFILKPLVDRARPWQVDAETYPELVKNDPGSFPSGHCTTAAAILVIVAAVITASWRRWFVPLAALLMIGTIWERTLTNSHWLTDSLAGTAFGAGLILLLWFALAPWIKKDFRGRPAEAQLAG